MSTETPESVRHGTGRLVTPARERLGCDAVTVSAGFGFAPCLTTQAWHIGGASVVGGHPHGGPPTKVSGRMFGKDHT
jgi:hypothetical protein